MDDESAASALGNFYSHKDRKANDYLYAIIIEYECGSSLDVGHNAYEQQNNPMYDSQNQPIRIDPPRTIATDAGLEELQLRKHPNRSFKSKQNLNNHFRKWESLVAQAAITMQSVNEQEGEHESWFDDSHAEQPRPHDQYARSVRLVHAFWLGAAQREEQVEEGERRLQGQEAAVDCFVLVCSVVPLRHFILWLPLVHSLERLVVYACRVLHGHSRVVIVHLVVQIRCRRLSDDAWVLIVLVGREASGRLVRHETVGLRRQFLSHIWQTGLMLPLIRQTGFIRQQLIDIVVKDYFVEADMFPAEGAVGVGLKTSHALPANGVVHAANDDGLAGAAVVAGKADVASVDVAEFLVYGVRPVHILEGNWTIYNGEIRRFMIAGYIDMRLWVEFGIWLAAMAVLYAVFF